MKNALKNLIQNYNGCGMKAEYEGTRSFYEAASCHYYNTRGRCVKRPHQNKQQISNKRLYGFADLLVQMQDDLESCTKFEDLQQMVNAVEYPGIGPVTRYDIATAVGYLQNPKVLPQKYVYLHAGVTKGYTALATMGLVPPCNGDRIGIDVFDCLKDLQLLDIEKYHILYGATFSMLVEDFLCVMHNELNKLVSNYK